MIIIAPHRLLLPLAILASSSAALPPPSDLSPIHPPINLTTPDPSANSAAHCITNTTPFARRRPRFTDCGAAIRQLPSSHVIGTFHTGGPDTAFRLPVTKTTGSCAVRVEMALRVGEEVSTWLTVGAAAMQVNMACVNQFTFPVKVGGWTTVGRQEGIRVELRFSGTRDE